MSPKAWRHAFGPDPGWQQYNLGLCAMSLGRAADALAAFERVVSDHSDHPYEWIVKRKAAAVAHLARIRERASS